VRADEVGEPRRATARMLRQRGRSSFEARPSGEHLRMTERERGGRNID
jgi:hypothetical protein